jgi:glycosyltransferase involved in cell wall biosynthesis
VEYFTNKLQKLWSDESIFSEIFKIEETNFWPIVSEVLYDLYRQRITEYLQLILTSKRIFSELNIKSILSLNILGETEKTILATNNYKIPSILLEHGAANYLPAISHYDISNAYPIFRDKIALWGNIQNDYLLQHRHIPADRIFVTGSPRHEDFFKKIKSNNTNSEKTILITPYAMTEFSGLVDTISFLRLEKLIVKIFQITEKLPNTKVIIKMHPTLAPGNEYVKNLFHKLNPNVKILQLESVLDVIDSCDVMIHIHTELFPSTVMYEAMILNKPIMNISMMDEKYDFEFIKDNAVLSDTDDLEGPIKQLLTDNDFQMQLITNGQKHLKRYFSNPTSASEKLANILTSYSN